MAAKDDKQQVARGTEEEPRTKTANASQDPNAELPMNGHRYGQRAGGSKVSIKTDDGDTVVWDDPDAVPGTIGDDAEESLRAIHSAGLPAAKVK